MAGVAPDDRAEADHRVHAAGAGQALGHHRELEGTRRPGHDGLGQIAAGLLEGVEGPGQQPVGDPAVELGAGQSRSGRPWPGRQRRRRGVESTDVPTRAAARCLASAGRRVRSEDVIEALEQVAHPLPLGPQVLDVLRRRAWAGCSPARRCPGRSPRGRRTWSGCWSSGAWWSRPGRPGSGRRSRTRGSRPGSPSSRLASTVSNPSSWRL